MSKGYIKLHRQLQDCWIWKEEEPFSKGQAWVDLLMMANHKDKKTFFDGYLIVVKKGQFISSIAKLSSRWKWDRKKVSKFLDLLENDEMVTTKRTTHGTTITIVNWDFYQLDGTTDGTTNGTTTTPTDGQPLPTNKNDKECIKNEKNIYTDDETLNDAIKDFIEHRKKLRKPMTEKAIQLFIAKLRKLSSTTEGQIHLINTAIERGWMTVYPEKQEIIENKDTSKLEELERRFME